MKVYVNSDKQEIRDSFSGHNLVHNLKGAEVAVLVENDLGFLLDFAEVICCPKKTFILSENNDLRSIVDNILDLFEPDYVERADSLLDVLNRMEEIKNEKSNNGKAYQLL